MASIDIDIAGRRYTIGCVDGGEDHLRSVAALVDRRARDAGQALGSLTESSQLLFAALFLADDLEEARNGTPGAQMPSGELAEALEGLAERVEELAARLES